MERSTDSVAGQQIPICEGLEVFMTGDPTESPTNTLSLQQYARCLVCPAPRGSELCKMPHNSSIREYGRRVRIRHFFPASGLPKPETL